MKSFLPLTLFAIATATTWSATAQDTTYFDMANHPADRQHACFSETTHKTDSGTAFTDRWMNGQLKTTGTIARNMLTRIGTFTYYDSTGSVLRRYVYTGNDGATETDYYPDGKVEAMGANLLEKKDGDWAGYYPSGKLRATAKFKEGRQVSANFFHEDGSADTSLTVFFQESGYPGGSAAWLRMLNKTLRYPDAAVNEELQGQVVVRFTVSKEGKTSDFAIVHSAGPSLDNEAMRVIRLSGDWQPAVYAGSPVVSVKTQPIVFRLEFADSKGRAQPSATDNSEVYSKVEIESCFPGGDMAWKRYLQRHLRYPRKTHGIQLQGPILVQFIVDRRGYVNDVQAINGPDTGGFREEAVRVIRESGLWTPAIQNGQLVRSLKTQPVDFNEN